MYYYEKFVNYFLFIKLIRKNRELVTREIRIASSQNTFFTRVNIKAKYKTGQKEQRGMQG